MQTDAGFSKICLYTKGKETWFKLQILLLVIQNISATEYAAEQLSEQRLISEPRRQSPNPAITFQGICFVFAVLTL